MAAVVSTDTEQAPQDIGNVTAEHAPAAPPVAGDRECDPTSEKFSWAWVVATAAILVYLGTLHHGFVFDDKYVIQQNQYVQSLSRVGDIFTTNEWAGAGLAVDAYRPLTSLTHALNWAIGGPGPFGFHLVNVLLHALASTLVLRLARSWGLSPLAAGVGALLFAVLPVHVEAVANVIGRKDVLSTVFVLATVLAHRAVVGGQGRAALLAPPLLFGAALLSKETGYAAAPIAFAADALLPRGAPRSPEWRHRAARLLVAYLIVGALYAVARHHAVGSLSLPPVSSIDNPLMHVSWSVRWGTALAVVGQGLLLQVLPLSLSPDYSFDAIPLVTSPSDVRFLGSVAALVVIGAVAWKLRRRSLVPAVLVARYFVTLLPGSNLPMPIPTIFGERILYMPSVATCIAAGMLVGALHRRRFPRASLVAAGVVVLAMGGRAFAYARVWSDEVALFDEAVRAVPRSTKAHAGLADSLQATGRPAEAIEPAREALKIRADNLHATMVLASALWNTGRRDEARELSQRALQLLPFVPRNAEWLYDVGCLHQATGDLDAAARRWLEALALDPRHARAHASMGYYHTSKGDTAQAVRHYMSSVEADPGLAAAWFNLGLAEESLGRREQAAAAFRRFLETAGPEQASEVAAIRQRYPELSTR